MMINVRVRRTGLLCGASIFVVLLTAFSLGAENDAGKGSVVLGALPAEATKPPHASSVVEGPVRFEVMAPNLVRMEYSPTSHFIDPPSVAVLKRDWPSVKFDSRRDGPWLEIKTDKLTLRYELGSGPFTAKNLQVGWTDERGQQAWKPGDKDDKNLGGVGISDVAGLVEMGKWTGPLSRNGYFLLDDSQTALWDRASQWVKPRLEKNGQDWYFFVYGQNYKAMLGQLAELVGSIPMVPRYVLGTWVSSRAAYSSDQWKMNAERLREESIPVDVIGLDSFSSAKFIWAGYDTDPEQLPDPQEFFHWMLDRGFHVFVNEHYKPITPDSSSSFEEVRKLLNLPPDTKEIPHNLANKTYAEAFMGILHRPLLDMGMAFWWQDGWAGATKMPGLDPAMWTRYVEYEGSEQITGERVFDLCRLGTWGSHRYGGYFSGDITPNWSTLDFHVPLDAQAGNVLTPYIATNSADGEIFVDRELYLRWMEFNALSPIFWWHAGWGLRFPWEYGPQALALSRKFLQLRYRLIPYLYSYVRLAHDEALPLVRGMYLEYPGQEMSYSYRDQYMFGRELLVAPITNPGYGKPVLKDVFLPAGDQWIDFFTGKIYQGGQVISHEYPIERMPLFVRAGSVVPMAPEMDYSDQRPVDPLILDVYAGKGAEFRLYEDDGTSLDYRKGASASTPISFTPDPAGSYRIEIGPSSGQYEGQEQTRRYEARVHGLLKPESVQVNGRKLAERQREEGGEGWIWDKDRYVTTINLPEPVSIRQKVTVTIEGAGTFEDVEMLQKVLDYRERVRNIRVEEQLKWAMWLTDLEFAKAPRVVRTTDQVESRLNWLVSHPAGIAQHPPNFRAMTNQLLTAFVDQPFESRRKIPSPEPEYRDAVPVLEHATFEPEEIRKMTTELLGCKLIAQSYDTPKLATLFGSAQPYPTIQAKLLYDPVAIGPAKVTYDIWLPDEGQPGWIQIKPPMSADAGYTQFNLRAPFQTGPGKHSLKLKAEITWEGGQLEIVRDVHWSPVGGRATLTDEDDSGKE